MWDLVEKSENWFPGITAHFTIVYLSTYLADPSVEPDKIALSESTNVRETTLVR